MSAFGRSRLRGRPRDQWCRLLSQRVLQGAGSDGTAGPKRVTAT